MTWKKTVNHGFNVSILKPELQFQNLFVLFIKSHSCNDFRVHLKGTDNFKVSDMYMLIFFKAFQKLSVILVLL